jgi:hypothetical protein
MLSMPTPELPTSTQPMFTSKRVLHCCEVNRPMVCPIRAQHHCHKTYTLKHINPVHLEAHQVHNGVHTHKTRRRALHHHHWRQVTIGTANGTPICPTHKCNLNPEIPMTGNACLLSSKRRRHRRHHHHPRCRRKDSRARLVTTQHASIRSNHNAHPHLRTVDSHRRLGATTQLLPHTRLPLNISHNISRSLRTHLIKAHPHHHRCIPSKSHLDSCTVHTLCHQLGQ